MNRFVPSHANLSESGQVGILDITDDTVYHLDSYKDVFCLLNQVSNENVNFKLKYVEYRSLVENTVKSSIESERTDLGKMVLRQLADNLEIEYDI